MSKVHCIISGNVINLVINDVMYSVSQSHISHNKIMSHVAESLTSGSEPDSNYLLKLLDVVKSIEHFSEGALTIIDNEFIYNGQKCNNELTEVITNLINNGQDFAYLARFLNKLMSNTDSRCVDAFWAFVNNAGLHICQDGDVLGYKAVNEDYTDCYTGKISNKPGVEVSLPRDYYLQDFGKACGKFFHIGTLEYARSFGPKLVLVKFNPTDVVSIPVDGDLDWKIRVCRYTVLCDYENKDNRLNNKFYEVIEGSVKPMLSVQAKLDKTYANDDDFNYNEDDDEQLCNCGTCDDFDDDDDWDISDSWNDDDEDDDY